MGSQHPHGHTATRRDRDHPHLHLHRLAKSNVNPDLYRHRHPNANPHRHLHANSVASTDRHEYNPARAHSHTTPHAVSFNNSLAMNFNRQIIFVALLLAGCGTNASPSPSQPSSLFDLVTSAPIPSATPTPFQPLPLGATSFFIPANDPLLLTSAADSAIATSSIPPETPTPLPTIDAVVLNNTIAPQPTFDSQLFNNGQKTINFLLIGSDRRSLTGSTRTDTMVIAILHPNEGQVALISIPRDLWVSIPGFENNRINTAYQVGKSTEYPGGGPGLLKETIQYNLGIRIDHTALVDFNGFANIVNTLGGVDVPVSCAYTDWRLIDPSYDPENENNWYLHTAEPGVIHMDGDLALWYARSRQKSNDFDRGRRQQEVLRALFTQALQAGTLTRIPELYENLKESVETDLGLGDLLQLSVYTPKMTNADIRSYYIRPPYVSSWITDGGASVLLPDKDLIPQLITEALSPPVKVAERQAVTIEVMNGTSIPGLDTLAATRLNYAGYETRVIPSARQDYGASVLIDKTIVQDAAFSAPILQVMGLPPNSLISGADPNSASNFLLILGADYEACFQPESLGQ